MKKFNVRFVSLVIIIWAADAFSKLWAVQTLSGSKTIKVFGSDLFRFHLVYNTGGVFGIAPGNAIFFQILTGLAITFLAVYYYKTLDNDNIFDMAVSFVLGGALGNFTDRFFRPGVVDFIDMEFFDIPALGLYRWPTYNVADAFISIGAVLMLVALIRIEKARARQESSK